MDHQAQAGTVVGTLSEAAFLSAVQSVWSSPSVPGLQYWIRLSLGRTVTRIDAVGLCTVDDITTNDSVTNFYFINSLYFSERIALIAMGF